MAHFPSNAQIDTLHRDILAAGYNISIDHVRHGLTMVDLFYETLSVQVGSANQKIL